MSSASCQLSKNVFSQMPSQGTFALQMEKRKTGLAFELLSTVIAHSDIGNTAMCTLAANLWGLVQRTGQADTKAMVCFPLSTV